MGTAVNSGQSLLLQRDDSGGVYSTLPITLAKGRPPKEALQNQKTIRFEVRSLEEFETALREHLESNPEHPEHILAKFNFWTGASFLVSPPQDITLRQQQHLGNAPLPTPSLEGQAQQPQQPQQQQHHNAPPGYQPATAFGASQYGGTQMNPPQGYNSVAPTAPPSDNPSNPPQQQPSDKINMTIDSVLIPTLVRDDRPTKNRQLVFAKALIAAVQRADGFRYSFHNSWYSGRDHRAFGFSYYCNDSFLNKDRAANGKGTKVGKRATKPVFPCGGLVRVLFSAVEKTLVLEYRHNPCHKTYAERAPPARPSSKRRRVGEGDTGADGVDGNAGSSANGGAVQPRPPKKKKRKDNAPLVSVESELLAQSRESMLGLILTDPLPGMETMRSQESGTSVQTNGAAGNENANGTVPGQEQAPTRPKPPKKARKSCDMCHYKRAKCDAVRPTCSTCREKSRQCIYPPEDGQQIGTEQEQSQDSAAVIAELRRKLADVEEKYAEAQAQIRELEAKERDRERANSSSMGPPVQTAPTVQTQPQPQPQTRMQPQMQPPRRQSHGRPSHVHYQPQTQSPLQAPPPSLQEQLRSHLQQEQPQSHSQSQAPSYIQQPQSYAQSQPPSQYQSQPPSQYQGQPPSHYPVQQAHSVPAPPYRQAHPQQAQQGQPSPWVFYQ